MLDSINSSNSSYISINMNNNSGPYPSGNHVGDGDVRFHNGRFEICNNGRWEPHYGGSATININPIVENMFHWVQQKMAEEQKIKELMSKHSGIRDLKEKLDLMIELVKEEA